MQTSRYRHMKQRPSSGGESAPQDVKRECFSERVKNLTALRSENMQHAFPVARHLCATALQDEVLRRGGSRDILMSFLVPINSLTTHASCSGQACGKVTHKEKKKHFQKGNWNDQRRQHSSCTDRSKTLTVFLNAQVCMAEYGFKPALKKGKGIKKTV